MTNLRTYQSELKQQEDGLMKTALLFRLGALNGEFLGNGRGKAPVVGAILRTVMQLGNIYSISVVGDFDMPHKSLHAQTSQTHVALSISHLFLLEAALLQDIQRGQTKLQDYKDELRHGLRWVVACLETYLVKSQSGVSLEQCLEFLELIEEGTTPDES